MALCCSSVDVYGVLVVALILGDGTNALFLPNVHPRFLFFFWRDEIVTIQVNVLTSVRAYPNYDYYNVLPCAVPVYLWKGRWVALVECLWEIVYNLLRTKIVVYLMMLRVKKSVKEK
ncbi:putative endosomal integral membrane protein [Trypanosoma rangeli]|uniref:Putative endosomal integral membrane protein n=1 Tax=Trypanosoma rangeli TaxID=5698 RepID=A0A3R7NW97_TRYRA|nr:putative endosomal integral membrane protein [Trypanosoma rangeli]RNF08704.1 putative endosomal integral membrane protein [Trypanosoma rangeli]|eukprot:RNF08704.1 putative endosomal integral membrane protein [Trypanosoma rangeli]